MLTLRNPSSEWVCVAGVEASCPCVTVAPLPAEIGPGESKDVIVNFDPSSEPDFRGGLSVVLEGYTPVGGVAFRTQADLEVLEKRSNEEIAIQP